MSDGLEQRLRDSAAQAARLTALAPLPDPPSGRARHRPDLFMLGSVVGVLLIVIGLIVITRQDSRDTISPSAPDTMPTTVVATTGVDVVSTTSVVTGSSAASNSSVVAADTGATVPDVTSTIDAAIPPAPTTTTDAVATGAAELGTPVAGTPIGDDQVVHGTPAALGVVPAGYRVALATEGAASTSSGGVSWVATYVHEPVVDGKMVDYVQVQINEPTDGDPYAGFPGLDQQPDVQIGSIVGRWYDFPGTVGYSTFVSVLGDQRQLLVSGHATRDVIASTVTGITLDPGGDTAAVTTLPDGYVLVDESPGSGPDASWEFDLLYAKGQAWRTAIDVRTLLRPEHPALMQTVGPDAPRIVDINGLQGVIVRGTLTIDVTADYQVQLTVGGPTPSLANDDIDQLVAFGRSLVSIGKSQFTQYQADALAAPFSPTDEGCDSYVTIANPRSNAANVATDSTLAIQTPGTITVDISTSQPLGQVEILLRVNGAGDLVLVGSLPSLEATATVDLTWDGTINGAPAPAATYDRLAIHADPADTTNPDACTNLPAETYKDGKLYSVNYGTGINLGAAFVVS